MLIEDWDELSVETVISAIENGYTEGKELEFKRQQNPDERGHKQSTVGEVVSFANAGGGDLVIGVGDEEGQATGLWPVEYDDIDDTVLRWVDIIKRNTDPELPQHLIDIEALEITEEHEEYLDDNARTRTGHILVMRVQRSWRSPHRETMNYQFYERSAGGKSELDAGAIRRAMLQGEVVVDRAKEFRDDRLARIRANDVSVPLLQEPTVVLHVVPSNAFAVEGVVDPTMASPSVGEREETIPSLLSPRGSQGHHTRYTEDGYLSGQRYDQYENRFGSYTLTLRSGVIEALTVNSYANRDNEYINSGHVRNCLEASLSDYIQFLSREGGAFPLYCFLSVVGAKGLPVAIQRTSGRDRDELEVIDRDVARLPAVRIETPNEDIDDSIDTLLDSLYKASGKAGETRVQD